MRIKHLLLKIYSNLSRPSFSFRNRLFVERNDKHARILGLLSNTFRASKWSNLSMTNITSRFNNLNTHSWTKPFYIVTGLVATYFLVDSLFGLTTLKLFISFTWAQFDATLQIAIQWLLIKYSIAVNFLYSRYINTFGTTLTVNSTSSEKPKTDAIALRNVSDIKAVSPIGPSKQLVFLSYLTGANPQMLKEVDLVRLFGHGLNRQVYEKNAAVLRLLFKTINTLGIQQLSLNGSAVKFNLARMVPTISAANRASLVSFRKSEGLEPSSEIRLRLESELNKFVPRAKELEANTPSLRLFRYIQEDQLQSYFEEGSIGYQAAVTPTAPFTFSDSTDVQKLTRRVDTTDLMPLEYSARLSNKFVEHQRRLYRFSMLHRSILQNSHKLTNAKRLITSGFYDSSLTSTNLWVSEFFQRSFTSNDAITHTVKHLLRQTTTLNGSYTPNTKFLSTYSNLSTPSLSLNTLNLFEKSYFWNIKRFYNFNTTHAITQVLRLDRNLDFGELKDTPLSVSQRSVLDVLQSHGLKSYSLTNPGFTKRPHTSATTISSATGLSSKAFYSQTDNASLFNPTNSTIVHDLLSSKDSSEVRTRSFPFFTDYSTYLTTSIDELTSLKDLNDLSSRSTYSDPTHSSYAYINDGILLKDLILLTKVK